MRDALTLLFGHKLPVPLEGTLERLLVLDRFNELYEQVRKAPNDGSFPERFLETMKVRTKISSGDLSLVPKEGPVVAVANHPFGLIEGAILSSLLATVRPDVKVMANHLLASLPEARPYCIFVNPFGGHDAVRSNQNGLKQGRRLARGISRRRSRALEPERGRRHRPHVESQHRPPGAAHWRHGLTHLFRGN
jgi:putative hemolysin